MVKLLNMFKMRSVNEAYDITPSIVHKYNTLVMEKYIPRNSKILDVGCWTGQLYTALANRRYQYTGIDISKEAISLAKRKYKDAVWKVSDATRLPFSNAKFDAVVMFEVLEHLGDKEEMCISELKRVLKKGGILILSTPAHNLLSLFSDPAYFLQNHKHYKEHKLREFLRKDFLVNNIWLKGNIIYVGMYLTQMFFKHVFKTVLPGFVQRNWERAAFDELKNRGGFLGYYLVARKK